MSPKHCSVCGTQGLCIDTRQHSTHIRRRYECACGAPRWTTIELLMQDTRRLQKDVKTFEALRTHLQGVLSDRTG